MRVTPVVMGITTATLAVVAQTFLDIQPPSAYGLCIICHGRDLAIRLVAAATGLKQDVAAVSAYWPLLTVIGVFIGSRYAAVIHDEHKEYQGENPWLAFFCGMVVMILGLMIMGCPIRLLMRAAYGDFIGAAGAIAVLVGAIIATIIMRWRVVRC